MPKITPKTAAKEKAPTEAKKTPKAKKAPKTAATPNVTETAPEQPQAQPQEPKPEGKGKVTKKTGTEKAPPLPSPEPKPEPKAEGKEDAPAPKKAFGGKKKEGLRGPQERILKAMLKAGKGLTRKEIAEQAPVDPAMCTEYLGSLDEAIRTRNDARYFPSLLTLGLIKAEQHDVEGKDTIQYSLTATGKKAAAELESKK